MANNYRKQSSKFFAHRWGAISYVFIFLSLSTSYGGTSQKSTKNQKKYQLLFNIYARCFYFNKNFFITI